jgi:hypothetical protein
LGRRRLPPDMKRVVMALACLTPVEDVGEIPLVTGAWCWNVPLWGNPLLPKEGSRVMGTTEGPGREFRHPELRGCRVLRTCTLGDALQARGNLEPALHAPNQARTGTRTVWNAAVEMNE